MNGKLNVKWNPVYKDYELTEESKTTMRQLPANISRAVLNQLQSATSFTREGKMNKITEVTYGN